MADLNFSESSQPLSESDVDLRRASLNTMNELDSLLAYRKATSPHHPQSSKRRPASISQPQPRPLPVSTRTPVSPLHNNLPPSAPASPPTPAPSPTPHQRAPSWTNAGEDEDKFLRDARSRFICLDSAERQRFLAEMLNLCDNQQLSFVHSFVSPRLKKDPFRRLPDELCLRVLSFIDDPRTLARASQVSKRWHELLTDDMTWKLLCEKHSYRRPLPDTSPYPSTDAFPAPASQACSPQASYQTSPYTNTSPTSRFLRTGIVPSASASAPCLATDSMAVVPATPKKRKRPKALSYKSHFKLRYMVETAWRRGGSSVCHHITPDQGVVTSLHLTSKYIVVALDTAKIHVYSTTGEHQKTLQGHVMGVWAMVPYEDTLVSGGCDRDVRVWNMATGESVHTLRGHTSTVRCLKMSDSTTAISGSRDTTLRIWDIKRGVCTNVLVGHQASVRCLEIHGDIVVSGSYDTTARVWSISEGRCLRTLNGHFSQIYAIAFDGKRIATGSLDTSVRIWDPNTGNCQAILQGHTLLVGQLQMRGDVLVTGGSDGSVRVWSLVTNRAIHRLAAHDNSVTSLQFDETRIVSAGSDGRVKVWGLESGQLIRELGSPAEAVWRVAFEQEKAVILAGRANRTIMEVWKFSPPEDALEEYYRSESPSSVPDKSDMDSTTDGNTTDEADDIKMTDAFSPGNDAMELSAPERTHAFGEGLGEGSI
ncbi:MAG: hypothetical protein M1814_000279 [Vezdaea aestivalis]|nr:MAG: hypothetical protein M1814_000279 [Vezdaea aestivalis]